MKAMYRMIYILLMAAAIPAVSCGSGGSGADGHDHASVEAGHDHAGETAVESGAVEDDHDHEAEEASEQAGHVHEDGEEAGHIHDESGAIASAGEEWEHLIGLETVPVEHRSMNRYVSVPGRLIPDPDGVAVISPFIESSVNQVFANLGDRVKKGDVLICLTSPEIGMLRAEYGKAEAELGIARRSFERASNLFNEKILPERTLQEAEAALKVAEVNYEYAGKKLLALGIESGEIDNPPAGHSDAVGATVHVRAPISGVVTARNASIGQKVGISDRLFEIVDLNTVWLEADLFEKDLPNVATGRVVKVEVSAWPGEYFTGKLSFIGSTVDNGTRTVKVMAAIPNTGGKLKPGMYARTGIVTEDNHDALAVPKEAVLDDENLKIVFVKEPAGYHRHVVQTGIEDGGFIEITGGLEEGDVVVTHGAYQLKSKSKMSAVDPHAGHNH